MQATFVLCALLTLFASQCGARDIYISNTAFTLTCVPCAPPATCYCADLAQAVAVSVQGDRILVKDYAPALSTVQRLRFNADTDASDTKKPCKKNALQKKKILLF